MRKLLTISAALLLLLCVGRSSAYEAQFLRMSLTNGTTNATSTVSVYGKMVYAAVYQDQADGATNSVTIATTAQTGATVGTAQTVLPATNVTTATVSTNVTIYCWNDTVTMTAIHGGTNAAPGNIYGVLILERP